ncbi:MAG: hypothetical protein ACK4E8_06815 [Lacibacter sp.]|jgi:hypothetical protein
MSQAPVKKCLQCGRTVKGRADKKFCDDSCRNAYNNMLKSASGADAHVRRINQALQKNRRILRSLLPGEEGMAKVHADKLNLLGFHFRYFTHQYTNKKGQVYNFCYDYGYLPLDHGWYLLVCRKE